MSWVGPPGELTRPTILKRQSQKTKGVCGCHTQGGGTTGIERAYSSGTHSSGQPHGRELCTRPRGPLPVRGQTGGGDGC